MTSSHCQSHAQAIDRRDFLRKSAFGFGATALASAAASSDDTVDFPSLGATKLQSQVEQDKPMTLSAASDGSEPKQIVQYKLLGAGGPAKDYLRFAKITIPGMKDPFVAAIAFEIGGSDCHYEITVIGVSGGRLVDLFESHPSASVQDAFCIERTAKSGKPIALLFNFIWAKGETHYADHRYKVSVFNWNGPAFELARTITTEQKHATWKAAAKELGFNCERNVIRVLYPDPC